MKWENLKSLFFHFIPLHFQTMKWTLLSISSFWYLNNKTKHLKYFVSFHHTFQFIPFTMKSFHSLLQPLNWFNTDLSYASQPFSTYSPTNPTYHWFSLLTAVHLTQSTIHAKDVNGIGRWLDSPFVFWEGSW